MAGGIHGLPQPKVLTTEGKGGASAPPLHHTRNGFFVSRPAQLVGLVCARRETNRELQAALRRG